MGELREPNAALIGDKVLPASDSTPWSLGAEHWEKAETATQKIISQFLPTADSEKSRRDVIDYVQRLIRGYLGCEVFPYGSVPLKTYLPDGDIDLTAFCDASVEDGLVNNIVSVLEGEEQNTASEFVVKDVQLIRAEVKLVKCIVQNIVVDISFNQIGGLCTLCFLEQVDRLIGKDHLFKQSIILIKAWCYYESRILGAHHGLISTYALETLVLYIFHVFHPILDGPLAVLYKFLDYFSKFDWDNYCISLIGPVHISALPEILAETPQIGGDLLLGSDFLRFCSDMFSVPSKFAASFSPKHLNIIDPLKDNNNLGRSVSRGNFYRIRSAFAYGARKLGQILMEPADNIVKELCTFFSNTLDRHGSGQRPDVQGSTSVHTPAFSTSDSGPCKEESISRLDSEECRGSQDAVQNMNVSVQGLRISDDSSNESVSPQRIHAPHAPHLYFSKLGKVKTKNGNLKTEQIESHDEKGDNDKFVNSVGSKSVRSASSAESNFWDLTGDYETHFMCLQYGWMYYEYGPSVPAVQMLPPPPSHFLSDPIQRASYFRRNGFSHGTVNGVAHGPVFYPMNQMLIPGIAFGSEEMPKQRGTGTYFPTMNRPPYGYRPSSVKGRNRGQARSPCSNGGAAVVPEANMLERSYLELPQSQFRVDQGGRTQKYSDFNLSDSAAGKLNPNANGFLPQSEGVSELGAGNHRIPLRSESSDPRTFSQGLPTPPEPQRPKPVLGMDRSSYHLKDDEDFPPLSV